MKRFLIGITGESKPRSFKQKLSNQQRDVFTVHRIADVYALDNPRTKTGTLLELAFENS